MNPFEMRRETKDLRERWRRSKFGVRNTLSAIPCADTSMLFNCDRMTGRKDLRYPCSKLTKYLVLHLFDALIDCECDKILYRSFKKSGKYRILAERSANSIFGPDVAWLKNDGVIWETESVREAYKKATVLNFETTANVTYTPKEV